MRHPRSCNVVLETTPSCNSFLIYWSSWNSARNLLLGRSLWWGYKIINSKLGTWCDKGCTAKFFFHFMGIDFFPEQLSVSVVFEFKLKFVDPLSIII